MAFLADLALPMSSTSAARYGALAAAGVASPRRCKVLPVGVPAPALRGVLVVAAAVPSRGANEEEPLLPVDKEGVAAAFAMEVRACKIRYRALAFFGPAALVFSAWETAGNSVHLLQFLLANSKVDSAEYKDVVRAGKACMMVEEQGKEGYMRADELVDAARGLRRAAEIFFPGREFPENGAVEAVVPRRGEDVNKELYKRELVEGFSAHFKFVAWQARVEFRYPWIGGP